MLVKAQVQVNLRYVDHKNTYTIPITHLSHPLSCLQVNEKVVKFRVEHVLFNLDN